MFLVKEARCCGMFDSKDLNDSRTDSVHSSAIPCFNFLRCPSRNPSSVSVSVSEEELELLEVQLLGDHSDASASTLSVEEDPKEDAGQHDASVLQRLRIACLRLVFSRCKRSDVVFRLICFTLLSALWVRALLMARLTI
mmetsp:Transcript_36895/g.85098  ORF Transcript_36895/g.85098 Transcript_36895/m.85098 type:complete len:139 (-) Transcript_36895:702-1118(-)